MLYTIAKEFKTTVADLTDINMLTTNVLYPNQVLLVPTHSKTLDITLLEYFTKNGDTMEKISNRVGVPIQTLGAYNDFGKVVLEENQRILYPTNERSYLVKSGDSVKSICEETGLSAEKILELNISPNMRIKI
jgi:LysM repeat protein